MTRQCTPDIARLVLAALATYRLTQFIVLDDGPGDCMFLLRRALGRYSFRPNEDDPSFVEPATAWGRLLECAYCVGMWAAMPFAALAYWPSRGGDLALVWLGIAGAQALLEGRRKLPTHPQKIRAGRK